MYIGVIEIVFIIAIVWTLFCALTAHPRNQGSDRDEDQ
jgi:hypothetical protein